MTQSLRIAAVLLAAGRSLRHPGQHKLCRNLRGYPLGLHAARTIATLAPAAMVAVCAEATRDLAPDLTALGFTTVWNASPHQGLASSLAIGVRAASRRDIDAVLVCLADMPFVTQGHLEALVETFSATRGATTVGSRVAGTTTIMPPAVFGSVMIDRLLTLEGDRGAGVLLASGAAVEASPLELADLDDAHDFERFDRPRSPD
jgi:molybdenum cofactor cytidylyltransferase